MKRTLILAAAGLLVAALCAGAFFEYRRQAERADLLTGTVEATQADITPKTSGYIAELAFKEGDRLAAGTLAARLTRPESEAAYRRDRAALRSAEAALAKAENGSREEEIGEARSQTEAARAAMDRAGEDFRRAEPLAASGAISRKEFDAYREARDAAAADWRAARERQRLLENGTREEDLAIARWNAEEAREALAVSKEAVDDLSVYAPLSGVVLTKNYEPGEYVAAGAPIGTLADLSDCWVKVYVPTEEMGRIAVGQPAEIFVDGAAAPFAGYIKEIKDSAEYTPRQSITKDERANLVFAVKVAARDNGEGILKPGMPADVRFL